MNITGELRNCIAAWEHDPGLAEDVLQGFCDDLRIYADRIDERAIGLPVDADGTPIRVGDEMDVGIVFAIGDEGVFMVRSRPGGKHEFDFFDGRACRHAQQDSWERIVEDAMDWDADGWERTRADAVSDLVARCERLAR